jgi:hypothetical protein
MANAALIQGYTGPGRLTTSIVGEASEITFKFGKKVIEVTNKRGEMGSYDMAQISAIHVTADGKEFTLGVMTKENENERSETASNPGNTGTPNQSGNKPGEAGKDAVSGGSGKDAAKPKS